MTEIKNIPVSNEFEIFNQYDSQAIADLNLYVVKAINHNLFLNKQFNLVYGCILKQLKPEDYEILQVKQPSKIKQVDYKSIVDHLHNAQMSEDEATDKLIKKTIANVNIGLLEKGTNKNTKSILFSDLNECKFFQSEFGGKIIIIEKEKEEFYIKREVMDHGLDDGLENPNVLYGGTTMCDQPEK